MHRICEWTQPGRFYCKNSSYVKYNAHLLISLSGPRTSTVRDTLRWAAYHELNIEYTETIYKFLEAKTSFPKKLPPPSASYQILTFSSLAVDLLCFLDKSFHANINCFMNRLHISIRNNKIANAATARVVTENHRLVYANLVHLA